MSNNNLMLEVKLKEFNTNLFIDLLNLADGEQLKAMMVMSRDRYNQKVMNRIKPIHIF